MLQLTSWPYCGRAAYSTPSSPFRPRRSTQFGAFSQNGTSAPLRRYAQMMLPKSKMFLEYAKRLAAAARARSARLESAERKVVL